MSDAVVLLNNYPIDRSDFKIIRGVQNEVLFFVRNLDRNPASTTSFQTLTINIVDPTSSTLLMSRNLTVPPTTTGLYMLTILPSETANWQTGTLRWSITVTRWDGSTVLLWTDRNYGPYSTLEVTEGPIPGPTAPIVLDPSTFIWNNLVAYSPILPGSAQLGYQGGVQTFAIYPLDYTGTVEIDASLAAQPTTDSDWFMVSTLPFVAGSAPAGPGGLGGTNIISTMNITGNYLWLRVLLTITFSFVPNGSGSISQILYTH